MGHFGEEQLRGIGDTGTIEGKESANDKSVRKGKKMDLIRNKKRLFDEIKSQVQICVYIHLPAMLVRLCCLYLQEI